MCLKFQIEAYICYDLIQHLRMQLRLHLILCVCDSFCTNCLIWHSSRIYRNPGRIKKRSTLWSSNSIKRHALLWQTYSNKMQVVYVEVFFNQSKENGFPAWRWCAFNDPTVASSDVRSSKEIYLFRDNKHLKNNAYKYHKLWRDEVTNPCTIILNSSCKAFCKFFAKFKSSQNTLNILREKTTCLDCIFINKTIKN